MDEILLPTIVVNYIELVDPLSNKKNISSYLLFWSHKNKQFFIDLVARDVAKFNNWIAVDKRVS